MTIAASWRAWATVSCSVAALSACTIKSESTSSGDSHSVSVSTGGTNSADTPLGPDDVRIKSVDGVLVMSLIGDTVRMQLSDSLRNSVAAEIRKDGEKDGDKSGIAAMVTKSVAGVVQSAMGFTVKTAAKDIKNLRYEDGHIRFELKDGDAKVKLNSDGKGENSTFSEADARKFIDAVNKKAGEISM